MELKAKTQGRNLEEGTEAGAVEDCFLLMSTYDLLKLLSFTTLDHIPGVEAHTKDLVLPHQ